MFIDKRTINLCKDIIYAVRCCIDSVSTVDQYGYVELRMHPFDRNWVTHPPIRSLN